MKSATQVAGTIALATLLASLAGCSSDADNKDGGNDGKLDVPVGDTPIDEHVDAVDGGSDAADAGGDVADTGGTVDTRTDQVVREVGTDGSVLPATNLVAVVLDRRQTSFHLTWTAPSAGNGQTVTGYIVRAAKVPITDANFDNLAVTIDAPYTATPAAPGAADQVDVRNLYVENDYYFAVAGIDTTNNRGAIAATAVAVRAPLNATALAGTAGAAEQFGFQIDGGGDANGDGKSDLLVGVATAKHAYLFFGGTTVGTTAGVVFTGDATTTASFGRGVAYIGDIDKDGRPDIAISDRGTPAHIYIYKGRATWPSALANTDADYVISVDASYASSILGASMARLGDFNGDGTDDFALGAPSFGGAMQGRVVVIFGKAGFASITLPDATNSLVIDADPAITNPQLGYRVVGLGHFYTASTGTTLVVSAPGNPAAASGFEGRLYAFHGRGAGTLAATAADHSVVGPAGTGRIGLALRTFGPMVNGLPSVGSGDPFERVSTANGSAYVFSGSVASGPFASRVVAFQGGAGVGLTGQAIVGGGISGSDQAFSIVGDATPDLVLASRDSTAFAIVDGRTIRSATSPLDADAMAAAKLAVPADWTATAEDGATLLPDINGDGYADFAISNAIGSVPGKVVVYW